jgi:muramidase (phage lysozyme)
MTGRRFKIVESVGSRLEDVNRYEDLAKHHPSSGREPNRDYETINGQLEEVRHIGGRTLIKKDFVLLVEGSNRSIPVPSPLAGYAKTSRAYGTLKIYDSPTNGQLIGQILHLHPTFKVNDGDAITYGQHIGLQAGTDRAGAQGYAIHVHAELEEGDFKRYIADMVNGTLNPDEAKPTVAENSIGGAKGDWCYPYLPTAGHSLQHLTALSKAKGGFYPIGGNGLWHGGIHLDKGTSDAFDQSRINCMTHGEVVAYRVDEEYPVSTYNGTPPFQIRAPFSTAFVLVKHTLQAKAPATEDASKPQPPALTIYSLYMHLKCWKDYRQDEKLERPAFWGSDLYTVNTRSNELNVRGEARSNAPIVGKLTKGAQIRVSGEGAFLKLEEVISGNTEPVLMPNEDGTLPGYVSSTFLMPKAQPKAMGSIVLLDPPVPIKAGDLIGHVGKYQNQSDGSPQELLHLEVFSCDDVPAFIGQSRTLAQNLSDEEKTLLKVHAGASKLIPHRDDIKTGNPPKLTDAGTEIGVDLILPQSLLDALPPEAKIKVAASNTATGCTPETNWWRLDDLLADKDGQPISGWLAEQDLITTRHSPWEWEGFDFVEDTDTPRSGLAYYLNTARRLSDDEKASYQGTIDQSDKGPVRTRLYDIIDSNRDGKMTSKEIQAALEKPWHAQSISQLVTKHESEWFWDAARWDELDDLMGHSADDPNQDWVAEKERIKTLSWWKELVGQPGIAADGVAWHFHPIALIHPETTDLRELRVRAFLRMIRVGEGTVGVGGYEKLFGGSSFIKDHGKTFSDHPQIKIKKSGYTSSASGAYQVMGYTWTDKSVMNFRNRLNIHDFTPLSQDRFCVALLKFKVRGKTLDLIISGKIKEAIENSSWEWASLPPGRYGQPIETMQEAIENYEKFLQEETNGISDLYLKPGFLKEFGY